MTKTCIGLAAALVLAGCDATKSCTRIGCVNGFTWALDSPVGVEALATAQVELCQNERCVSGAVIRESPEPGVGTGISLMNAAGDRLDVTVWRGTDQVELDLYWYLAAEQARDGDVYRLTLRDAQGTALLERTHTVAKYDEHYPNGKDCDEESCRSAWLDERAAADE
jgi:hypothetical protein